MLAQSGVSECNQYRDVPVEENKWNECEQSHASTTCPVWIL